MSVPLIYYFFLFISGSWTRSTTRVTDVWLQSHTEGTRIDRAGTAAGNRARTRWACVEVR